MPQAWFNEWLPVPGLFATLHFSMICSAGNFCVIIFLWQLCFDEDAIVPFQTMCFFRIVTPLIMRSMATLPPFLRTHLPLKSIILVFVPKPKFWWICWRRTHSTEILQPSSVDANMPMYQRFLSPNVNETKIQAPDEHPLQTNSFVQFSRNSSSTYKNVINLQGVRFILWNPHPGGSQR